jgi:hypothetical protein
MMVNGESSRVTVTAQREFCSWCDLGDLDQVEDPVEFVYRVSRTDRTKASS